MMRWEDDGLWATDPAAEEVSRMLDAICPRCDGPAHEGTCATTRDPWAHIPDVCGTVECPGCWAEAYKPPSHVPPDECEAESD